MHPLVRETVASLRALPARAGGVVRRRLVACALSLAGVGVAVFLLRRFDVPLDVAVAQGRTDAAWRVARGFSFWGDWLRGWAALALVVWGAGLVRRRPAWREAAVAAVLAAAVAGALAVGVQVTVGRPRPGTPLEDRLQGPTLQAELRSFPSAHAATSFGTAAALAAAVPVAGVPSLAVAAGVAWSRVYVGKHYVTDVLAGSALGALVGIALGVAARRTTR